MKNKNAQPSKAELSASLRRHLIKHSAASHSPERALESYFYLDPLIVLQVNRARGRHA
jgi:hypothetical protein